MSIETWLASNTASLAGKTVAVSGSTGGLGRELCRYLARLGASLLLLDRNPARAEALCADLVRHYAVSVRYIPLDLSEITSVRAAVHLLKAEPLDALILNAGAYSIPRKTCTTGLDNVFQINFASPYYMVKELLPLLRERGGRVVAVGSIAHNYSRTDEADVDFATRQKASLVYGNAKRYLMFALHELFRDEKRAHLAITHPGISFTGITAHYPKLIFAIIKHPMKVIFMKPKKACLSILRGLFLSCEYGTWIGPRFFDVWGMPKKKRLTTCPPEERARIAAHAERIYASLM